MSARGSPHLVTKAIQHQHSALKFIASAYRGEPMENNHGFDAQQLGLGDPVTDHSNPHFYSLTVRVGRCEIWREFFTAPSYAIIAARFEAAIERIREIRRNAQLGRCSECGRVDPAPSTSFYLWVLTGDGDHDPILKENHEDSSLSMMIRLLQVTAENLRHRPELPKLCKCCGRPI